MARKLKKQTRTPKKVSPVQDSIPAIKLPQAPRMSLPNVLKNSTDYSQFAYVSEDLKKIAVITSIILLSYAVIFVANHQLGLF